MGVKTLIKTVFFIAKKLTWHFVDPLECHVLFEWAFHCFNNMEPGLGKSRKRLVFNDTFIQLFMYNCIKKFKTDPSIQV